MKAPWLTQLFNESFQGMMKVKLTGRREGDVLLTQAAVDTKKMPAEMRQQMKAVPFFDGKPIEGRMVVAGERLLICIGPGSKARLAALRAAPAAPPAAGSMEPAIAAALSDTNGEDAVYYMDLAASMKPMLAMAASGGDPSMKATLARGGGPGPADQAKMVQALIADARLATWGSYRGGDNARVTWRIPMTTIESIGALVAKATGGAGPR
jgi:hypothetical protein